MPTWDSDQYLRFARERTQPARDLAARLDVPAGESVLDLGCGPGNSTAVLAKLFSGAAITGADNSDAMLARARVDHPELCFVHLDATGDLSAFEGQYGLVFSNACLHWIPDHQSLIPRLMRLLKPGGTLAVQVPVAKRMQMYSEVVWPIVEQPRWRKLLIERPVFGTLAADEYLDVLSGCASDFDLWETTYYHLLGEPREVLEWFRGSGLRPYLQQLEPDDAEAFEGEVLERIEEVFPRRADGGVTLRFPRLFFVARN
ncbi:MAG: methyltransferase domain-containing protein [Coriobacteriales bacterium]|nr:methyltransferase domain-containing protein [Coriobacteriales bacterium]